MSGYWLKLFLVVVLTSKLIRVGMAAVSLCSYCPANYCTNCNTNGLWCPSFGSSTCSCSQVSRGYYNLAANVCTGLNYPPSCSPGTFSNVSGSSTCSQCPSGLFSSVNASTACKFCSIGKYAPVAGLSACVDCPSGFTPSVNGSTSCDSCSWGYYNDSNSLTCLPCNVGLYSSAIGSTACNSCDVGFYSDILGSSVCNACGTGFYSDLNGAKVCQHCNAGLFSGSSGSSVCNPCYVGFYSATNGSSACSQCNIGYFSYSDSSYECQVCDNGRSSDSGSSSCFECSQGRFREVTVAPSCLSCPQGKFANVTGLSICTNCDFANHESTSSDGSLNCSVCMEGYFGSPPLKPCIACSVNEEAVTCPLGSTLPFIKHGYCRTEQEPFFSNCLPTLACVSTGYENVTSCEIGYGGECCSECSYRFYRRNGVCVKCPATELQVTIMVLICLLLVAVLTRMFISTGVMSADVRITIQLIQLLALYPNISVKWPTTLQQMFQVLSLTNLSIDVFAVECSVKFTFWDQLYLKAFLPLILVFIYFLGINSESLVSRTLKKGSTGSNSNNKNKMVILRVWSFTAFVLTTLTTLNISSVLSLFQCIERADGTYSIAKYPTVKCYDAQWSGKIVAPSILFFFFAVIFPLYMIHAFWKNSMAIHSDQFVLRYGALVRPYRSEFYYWEFVVVLKRYLVVILNDGLLQNDRSYSWKFALTNSLLFAFVFLDLFFQPYQFGTNFLSVR
jgi:hypothetical protein